MVSNSGVSRQRVLTISASTRPPSTLRNTVPPANRKVFSSDVRKVGSVGQLPEVVQADEVLHRIDDVGVEQAVDKGLDDGDQAQHDEQHQDRAAGPGSRRASAAAPCSATGAFRAAAGGHGWHGYSVNGIAAPGRQVADPPGATNWAGGWSLTGGAPPSDAMAAGDQSVP